MATRLLLFLSFLLCPATSAFALHLGELAELGQATGRATSPEVRLTTLTDGRIVAAWTSPGTADLSSARARILDADGQPDGDDLFCTQPEEEPKSFRARIAPLGGGFVLGCDVVIQEPPHGTIARLRRFSGDGTVTGDPIEFDRHFITQMDRLVSSSATSFVATVEQCDSVCGSVSRVIGDNGERQGRIPEPSVGFQRLEPLAGGNYLAIRFGKSGVNGKATLSVRRFSASGERIGSKQRLARVSLSAAAMQTVRGSNGRIAVKWDTVGAADRPTRTHVVLFDETGEQIGDKRVVSNLPIDENSTSVLFALPLESGFALLSVSDSMIFAQAYSAEGEAVGNRADLEPRPALVDSVTFIETEQAYVLGGLSESVWPSPSIAALWRLDL